MIAGIFLALIIMVSTCDSISSEKELSGVIHFSGREFAGSATCAQCHASITESHSHTPHSLTSVSSPGNVRGSFDSGENVLILTEKVKVVMERTDSGLFQSGFVDGRKMISKRFDISIGSGRKGQSYLYWNDRSLFQLPVSWYAPRDTWSNSPGFPVGDLVFNRNITARCLECHSTFFKTEKMIEGRETFDPSQVMLGVACERCHGPAADHVNFHTEHPDEKEPAHIVNPARLGRQRKLDNCALCHSGVRENIMPSFSYVVGEDLAEFSYAGSPADSAATLDVHGNQYGLLAASKCFKSGSLDCSSCHNVHVKETNQLQLFSGRCMSCHVEGSDNFCKQEPLPGFDLARNCIDCHMPALPSRQVFLRTADNLNQTPFFVRTHLIGIYEEKIKEYLHQLSNENTGH